MASSRGAGAPPKHQSLRGSGTGLIARPRPAPASSIVAIAYASELGRQLLPAPILGRRQGIDSHEQVDAERLRQEPGHHRFTQAQESHRAGAHTRRSRVDTTPDRAVVALTPEKARGLMSTSTQPDASARSGHLNCPRCGLSIEVRPHRTAIRHCPRCVARGRVIVELFSSTLPADVLYADSALPRVEAELEFADDTLAITDTAAGARHQQTQVLDKPRRPLPFALASTRPMAVSSSAIDERAASPRSRSRLATCPSCSPAGRAGRALPRSAHRAQRTAIPRRHQGMEMAYALLIGRDGALRPPTTFTTPTAVAIRPGSAYGASASATDFDLDPHPAVQFTALTTPITHKGAGYAS